MISRERRRSFQRRVLAWYAAHGRDLPWRRTRDPQPYFDIAATPRARSSELWSLAAAVIPRCKGYLINQALMDLGALVCRARGPRCPDLPAATRLRLQAAGRAGVTTTPALTDRSY